MAQEIHDEKLQRHPGILLVIGRNDVPGRVVFIRALNSILVGRHVLIPIGALLNISRVVFPELVFPLRALQQILLLGFLGQVKEDFDDLDSPGR